MRPYVSHHASLMAEIRHASIRRSGLVLFLRTPYVAFVVAVLLGGALLGKCSGLVPKLPRLRLALMDDHEYARFLEHVSSLVAWLKIDIMTGRVRRNVAHDAFASAYERRFGLQGTRFGSLENGLQTRCEWGVVWVPRWLRRWFGWEEIT